MPETIITGMFSLLGIIVGGSIGYMTAIKISDRKRLQETALDFYDAFLNSIMSLDSRYKHGENVETNVYEILSRDFAKQIKAMLRFRLYLPTDHKEAFDKAWYEYCHYDVDGEPPHPFLEQYFDIMWEGEPTDELQFNRIRKLMKFVESVHKSPFDI